jgi:hypothetical protein
MSVTDMYDWIGGVNGMTSKEFSESNEHKPTPEGHLPPPEATIMPPYIGRSALEGQAAMQKGYFAQRLAAEGATPALFEATRSITPPSPEEQQAVHGQVASLMARLFVKHAPFVDILNKRADGTVVDRSQQLMLQHEVNGAVAKLFIVERDGIDVELTDLEPPTMVGGEVVSSPLPEDGTLYSYEQRDGHTVRMDGSAADGPAVGEQEVLLLQALAETASPPQYTLDEVMDMTQLFVDDRQGILFGKDLTDIGQRLMRHEVDRAADAFIQAAVSFAQKDGQPLAVNMPHDEERPTERGTAHISVALHDRYGRILPRLTITEERPATTAEIIAAGLGASGDDSSPYMFGRSLQLWTLLIGGRNQYQRVAGSIEETLYDPANGHGPAAGKLLMKADVAPNSSNIVRLRNYLQQ